MSVKKEETIKGFRDSVVCGEDVERIRLTIYRKRKPFQKQKVDQVEWHKGHYPLRIIIEDSTVWGKGRI